MKFKSVFLSFICIFLLGNAQANVIVNSVITSESRCVASGTITIYSPGAITYSIIAGPEIRPAQSNNIFEDLPPGNYTVSVTNSLNETATAACSIMGSYAMPSLSPILNIPYCNDASGSIIGNATLNSGRAPYKWALITPSAILRPDQVSDTFPNLSAGTYTLRITDSCGNFQTRTLLLNAPANTVDGMYLSQRKSGCDTFALEGGVSAIRPPFTYTFATSNGIGDTTYTTNGNPSAHYLVGYGQTGTLTMTNGCGNSVSSSYSSIDTVIYVRKGYSNCKTNYYPFPQRDGILSNQYRYPLNWYLLNNAGDTVEHPISDTWGGSVFNNGVNGQTYTALLIDACGFRTSYSFVWEDAKAFMQAYYIIPSGCVDSTASLVIDAYYVSGATMKIIDGPATYQSTKPKFSNTYVYPYPITIGGHWTSGFGVGTYTATVEDTCGHRDTTSFTITEADVCNRVYNYSYTPGCIGANKMHLSIPMGGAGGVYGTRVEYSITKIGGGKVGAVDSVTGYSTPDVAFDINNVTAGTYALRLNFVNYLGGILPYCSDIYDTLIIAPYVNPSINSIAQAHCGGSIHASVIPDNGKGVQPFLYQIIAGPGGYTAAQQSSPEFILHTTGSYTFRLEDACGNTNTYSTSLGVLNPPTITESGTGCMGGNKRFIAPQNPYYIYKWIKPDNTVYTGDILQISPIQLSDYGIYKVYLNSTVSGCTDSSVATLAFAPCSVLATSNDNFYLQNLNNRKVALTWKNEGPNIIEYIIERSVDGTNFTRLFSKNGGNSSYNVFDYSPATGINFYRIHSIDINGNEKYSKVLSIDIIRSSGNMYVYPNPASGNMVHISSIAEVSDNQALIYLYNSLGQPVKSAKVKINKRINELTLDIQGLPSGMYEIKIKQADTVLIQKITIQH